MLKIKDCLNKRTLILGDINAGKTGLTQKILRAFIRAGFSKDIAVLDLAPQPIKGVGGKLEAAAGAPLLYLTAEIVAPRMTGSDANHTKRLAEQNARVIEGLFETLLKKKKKILFVNDATLYLQAGAMLKFEQILASASTAIVNAYYGRTFPDSELSRREKRLTEELMVLCQNVLHI